MKNLIKTFTINLFLLITLCLSIYSCDRDYNYYNSNKIIYDSDSETPLITFVLETGNIENQQFNNEIRKTVNYTKIPYKQLDIKRLNKEGLIPKTTKVLIIQNTKSLSKKAMANILKYVASGNTIYFPNINVDKNFAFLAGIKRNVQLITNIEAQGFHFKKAIIPGFKNKSYQNNSKHFGFDRENYKNDIDILATAANDSIYPTIIRHKIGNGQVLTMNSSMVASKQNRGLLFGSILSGLEQIPYPIASVSTIFLDDFPAPLYKVLKEPISSELKMNQADFYVKQWWPDLLKLAKKHNIKYTTVACFDYRGNTSPPFLFNEWESLKPTALPQNNSITDILMKDVIANGHESGLHGYNHESLIKEDWSNPDFMETSLISINKRWQSLNYGDLPISYVPPSNHIDSLGIAALEKATPTIKFMSSTYLGNFEDGGNREYDDEPYSYYIFDFPRITSGYVLDQESQFDQQSLYLYTGIWSHFIHPDDVYQIPDKSNEDSKGDFKYRNGEKHGWQTSADGSIGMLPRFENYLKKTQELFPMMRFLTTEDAASITKSWRYSSYDYSFNKNELTVRSTNEDDNSYWFMYVSSKNKQAVENNLNEKKIKFSKTPMLDGYLYNINTNGAKFTSKLSNHNQSIDAFAYKLIQEDYKDYNSNQIFFNSLDEEISYLVSEKQLSKAISLLEKKIKTNKNFSQKDWLDFHKYCGWDEQQYKLWSLLDSYYLQSKSKDYVILSRLFTESDNYPSLKIRKKWIKRQLKFFPNDAVLRAEYNKYFVIENDVNISTDNIIYSMETSHNMKENGKLFQLLLSRDQTKAKQYLNTKTPCEDGFLIAVADQIAWLYADKKEYKAALAWAECTTKIKQENLAYWRTSTGEYEFLKTSNYSQYIEHLLAFKPGEAILELINKEPCIPELINSNSDIAYAFASIGAYRKAIDWSKCNPNFSIKSQFQWYLELRKYTALENIYAKYKQEHPEDNSLDIAMADIYINKNDYKKAFQLFSTLSPSIEKNKIQKLLNENAVYISNNNILRYLLKNHSPVFYKDVKDKLVKRLRLSTGSTLEASSNIFADQLNPTYLNNQLVYTFSSRENNKHSIGFTQSRAYSIPINFIDDNNIDHNLFGISYNFKSKDRIEKINYSYGLQFELDEDKSAFYHLNSGLTYAKEKSYSAIELSYKPVNTGPAYSLNIYRAQIAIFQEITFNKRLETSFSFEGNLYSGNVLDGLLLSKLASPFKLGTKGKFAPYFEIAGMLGNTNQDSGFPFWTIKERLYGGPGVAYSFNNPEKKIMLNLNAAFFKDTFSDSFFRYSGQATYPIFSSFYFKANVEFFTLKNFYSNNFSFGLKYHFKDR